MSARDINARRIEAGGIFVLQQARSTMKAGSTLLLSTLLATSAIASRDRVGFTKRAYTPPPGSPGFYHGNSTAAVTFDNLSAFVDNKRVFIFSGEFHPWRLPSGAGAWRDVLQKMKVCPNISLIHLLLPTHPPSTGSWVQR
jgi:hypothetical protein